MTGREQRPSAGGKAAEEKEPAPASMDGQPAEGVPADNSPSPIQPPHQMPPQIQSQAATWRHRFLARIYPPAMWMRNSLRHRAGQVSIGTCALIARADGTVLLVRHSYRRGWCLPGGGMKRGEKPSSALARELLEEVGLELTAPPRLHGIYLQPWFGMIDYPILFLVDGDNGIRGSARVAGTLEILEVGWFPARNLPPDTDPSVRARIADWLDRPEGGPVGDEIW